MEVGSDGSISRAGVVYNYIPMYHHRGSGIPFPLTILLLVHLLLLVVIVIVVDCWCETRRVVRYFHNLHDANNTSIPNDPQSPHKDRNGISLVVVVAVVVVIVVGDNRAWMALGSEPQPTMLSNRLTNKVALSARSVWSWVGDDDDDDEVVPQSSKKRRESW